MRSPGGQGNLLRYSLIVVAVLAALAVLPATYAAQRYGDLDPGFGRAGKVTLDLGDSYDQATGVAVQPDGKIVVAAASRPGDYLPQPLTLLRYTPDGDLDAGFGAGGEARYGVPDG